MLSEEEIENALNNLWNSLDDVLFNVTYGQEEMQEDLRIILNQYNYLDIMNERKKQQIEQLESNNQKLIEKLENDIKSDYHIKEYIGNSYCITGEKKIPTKQYAQDILEIVKGEKE